VIDAVDRAIAQREAMDRGFGRATVVSASAHVVLIVGALVVPALLPKAPLIHAQTVFAIPLPRGGGGSPQLEPPRPDASPAEKAKEDAPPKPERIQKPPKDEPRKGLPTVDAKKGPERKQTVQPARAAESATPGLSFGPVGPGTPDGTDGSGDWYLAGVQRRVWTIWMSQVRLATAQPAIVSFTIESDGSVVEVQLVQSCGFSTVDFAAQRAIRSAAPFAPLPKHYGTNRLTIQAVFKPTTT
jgi:TonB family protein